MTDLRQTSATLVLGAELDGRFFLRNARRELVVELYKPFGRKVELGVEPGSYEHVGAGVDIHLSRRWSFGLSVVYNWMADFSEPIGKRDNFGGFDLRLSVGWLFGKGSAPRP